MNTVKKDNLVSIKHVAFRLDTSVRGIYRLIARREFPPPVKVGGASKFYDSDVDAYLSRLREGRKSR